MALLFISVRLFVISTPAALGSSKNPERKDESQNAYLTKSLCSLSCRLFRMENKMLVQNRLPTTNIRNC